MNAPGLSRRRFLAAMGLVGVVIAAPQVGRGIPLRAEDLAQILRASRFRPLIGQRFTFQPSGQPVVRLVLRAVERISPAEDPDGSFELRFDGPVSARQGGSTGELRGGDLPPITLFVVPTGRPESDGQEWTASILGGGGRV